MIYYPVVKSILICGRELIFEGWFGFGETTPQSNSNLF